MTTPQVEQPSGIAVVSTGCCPPFDPSTWHNHETIWTNRLFAKLRFRSFLHIPLNMGPQILRAQRQIDAVHAQPEQPLMLTTDSSKWATDAWISVTKPVPELNMTTLSGHFMTRVYDAPYRDAPKWMADMTQYVKAQGRTPEKLFLAYTMCPACAKAYGHNYVIVFAKIAGTIHSRFSPEAAVLKINQGSFS